MAVGQLRTVGVTAMVTSLAWIAGIAAWGFMQPQPGPAGSKAAFVAQQAASMPSGGGGSAARRGPGGLVIPVTGVAPGQLVDTFEQARAAGARRHDAIDIPAPRGTPVVAAADGRVEKLFLSKDGGNTVYVRSRDAGLLYYYAHLDSYAPGLAEGMEVRGSYTVRRAGGMGTPGRPCHVSAPTLRLATGIACAGRRPTPSAESPRAS